MIYKAIGITYYPLELGSTYNCTITDQKQTNNTKLLSNSTVFLYDLNKASNTSAENNNTVSVSLSQNSGSISLVGYRYISNDITYSENLNNVTLLDFTIQNLRDPGASIIIYGGGTGIITTQKITYSSIVGGKTVKVTGTFTVSSTTFIYPNSSSITIRVTPTWSGTNVDAADTWTSQHWNVNGHGANITAINGNGNYTGGTFTFNCPIGTEWTTSTPNILVYGSKIRAHYKFSGSGTQVYAGFRVNSGGWQSTTYGWVVTGWSKPNGQGSALTVEYGDYPNAEQSGSYYCCTSVGEEDAWVLSSNGEPYYTTLPGDTYEGYIVATGDGVGYIEQI